MSNNLEKRGIDHPDCKEINDWFLYGPKNGQIEGIVRDLTLTHGLRLAEIENEILEALRKMKTSLRADSSLTRTGLSSTAGLLT